MTVHQFPTGAQIGGPDFEVGDLVTLLSGGPTLTVLDYCDECDNVDVAWFDGYALEIATLPGDALVHV